MQLKFWLQMKQYTSLHPESALAKIWVIGIQRRSSYLHYYQQMENEYSEPKLCEDNIRNQTLESYKEKITRQYNSDSNSKLGIYYQINPNLVSHVHTPQAILEYERELVTRFRTGSHSLAVELGRYSNTPRENRVCRCGTGVQTVWHVFSECPLTRTIVQTNYSNLNEIFDDEDIHSLLLAVTKELKVQIW